MKAGSRDVLSGTILLALATGIFILGAGIKRILPIGVGSGFFPKVVAVLLAVVALSIIWSGWKALRVDGGVVARLSREQCRVVFATLALIGLYVFLMEPVGFLVSTFVYLVCQFAVLAPSEDRHWKWFIGIAVAATLLIYFAFVYFFDLILPVGILG